MRYYGPSVWCRKRETRQKIKSERFKTRTYKLCWVLGTKMFTHTNESVCILSSGALTMPDKTEGLKLYGSLSHKAQIFINSVRLPFTLKFDVSDAILLYIIPVIEPSGVCQVDQQAHLNLKIIRSMMNIDFFWSNRTNNQQNNQSAPSCS